MSYPPFMEPPPPEHPVRGGDWFPHIIRHEPQGDGTVLVTWALPGLTTATVRVPVSSWLNGDHHPTGTFLGAFIQPLLPYPAESPQHPHDDQDI